MSEAPNRVHELWVRIIPMPFGVAVWLVHHLRELGALPPSIDHEGEGVGT